MKGELGCKAEKREEHILGRGTAATRAGRQGQTQSADQWGTPRAGTLQRAIDRRRDPRIRGQVTTNRRKDLLLFTCKIQPPHTVNTPLLELVELWVEDFLIQGILRNNPIVVH